MYVCMYVCMYVVKRVDLHKNMLFGETSLVKPESLYAYYNAMLIQKINFLNMYVCYMYVCAHACVRVRACVRACVCVCVCVLKWAYP